MQELMLRQDLVEADLTCLMCGRLIGEVNGLLSRDLRGERAIPSRLRWTWFRPAGADGRHVLCTGPERLRCQDCGGAAVMEASAVSAVRAPVAREHTSCPIHRDRMHGRGRRPRGCLCG